MVLQDKVLKFARIASLMKKSADRYLLLQIINQDWSENFYAQYRCNSDALGIQVWMIIATLIAIKKPSKAMVQM